MNVPVTASGFENVPATRVTDMFGVYMGFMSVASGWPHGEYAVTVSDGATVVTSRTVLQQP